MSPIAPPTGTLAYVLIALAALIVPYVVIYVLPMACLVGGLHLLRVVSSVMDSGSDADDGATVYDADESDVTVTAPTRTPPPNRRPPSASEAPSETALAVPTAANVSAWYANGNYDRYGYRAEDEFESDLERAIDHHDDTAIPTPIDDPADSD